MGQASRMFSLGVCCEVLAGLPGHGSVPIYLHASKPTPWQEGLVVRFSTGDGHCLIANFQQGSSQRSEVMPWPGSDNVAVIAGGYFYLFHIQEPESFVTLGSNADHLVTDFCFDENLRTLFVAAHNLVFAFGMSRRLVWVKRLASIVTKIIGFADGLLIVETENGKQRLIEKAPFSLQEVLDEEAYSECLFGVMESRSEVKRISPGLSDAEIVDVERQFRFKFPLDLRRLLELGMPLGPQFPDWRYMSSEDLQGRLNSPVEGIWFDIEHSGFWLPEWGRKPNDQKSRRKVLHQATTNTPRLIPVFGRGFIPCSPYEPGNPVFLVHQTDVMLAGNDLPDYFHRQFHVPLPTWAATMPKRIPFWSDAVKWRHHHEYYKTK